MLTTFGLNMGSYIQSKTFILNTQQTNNLTKPSYVYGGEILPALLLSSPLSFVPNWEQLI